MEKNIILTQKEINAYISAFKEFHRDIETIDNVTGVNQLENCTFELIDYINTNEELIFEEKLRMKIIPEADLSQNYILEFKGYQYTIDEDEPTKPTIQTSYLPLIHVSDNIYENETPFDVIYVLPEDMKLVTKYNKREYVPRW